MTIDLKPSFSEEPDLDAMTPDELRSCLRELEERMAALDEQEPRNMESEAYENWADAHEALEDLLDEVLDRLEDLEN